jgi:hypothetical protein
MKFKMIFFVLTCALCCMSLAADDEIDNGTIDENFKVSGNELKIKMNIDGGEVQVIRNDKSNECHVRIEYNPERCDADVRFYEKRNELNIDLDFDDVHFWNKEDHDNSWTADVLVELPYDPVISMETEIKAGESDFDLGDIHLRDFELDNWAGEVKVDFDKPNRTDMDVFDVNVHIGETELANLGNANLNEAIINGGIGEMRVDFNGELKTKVMARVDLDIGETTIIVPEKLAVKMKVSKFLFLSEIQYPDWFTRKGRYFYSENYDENDKSLYLDISAGIGELKVQIE